MTEEEALSWFRSRYDVSRETLVEAYLKLLKRESAQQNLISRSTLDQCWDRHVVDSAQLLELGAPNDGLWVDIGTGAGLPGIIIAILRDAPIALVEPRRRRIEFLSEVKQALGLDHVELICARAERYQPSEPVAVISARAVAALPDLFASSAHIGNSSTIWLLPKGRQAESEVEAARATWQGVFHVKPSLTQAGSGIVVACGVTRR